MHGISTNLGIPETEVRARLKQLIDKDIIIRSSIPDKDGNELLYHPQTLQSLLLPFREIRRRFAKPSRLTMDLQNICIVFFGGPAVKLLNLAELHNIPKDRRPNLRELLYWVDFMVGPAAGGFLAWVYQTAGTPLSGIIALNVGVSAPLILRKLADSVPKSIPTNTD